MPQILIIPGYPKPGPGHWQSLWEASRAEARWVDMPGYDRPRKVPWVEALDEAITACQEPPILVAHGLGCLAVAHWAREHDRAIRGALLAVPEDVDRRDADPRLRGFAPVPRRRLPFPAILAASTNDSHLALDRARALAADWGARLAELEACGHLDQAAGFGPWPRGESLLAELR